MKIYTVKDFILSPLGDGTTENFQQVLNNKSGIQKLMDQTISTEQIYASKIEDRKYHQGFHEKELLDFTELEVQIIYVIKKTLEEVGITDFNKFLLLISTTKGNVDLLRNNPENIQIDRVFLPVMASAINDYFRFPNKPVVVSNACISGVSGLLTAKKMIQNGLYDHVLVVGADALTQFVYSGFQSFMALSDGMCKPYDKNRDGINLGESVTGILVSKEREISQNNDALSEICGGGQANDANHISGPSRDGLGLRIAIEKAMKQAAISSDDISYINAHGTATLFNDEMEGIAFDTLRMNKIPVNSLKGYYGHTLGAAGVLETALAIRQMNKGTLAKSLGYKEIGLSKNINIIQNNLETENIEYILKTASGFGGGNAAIILKKVWN